MQNFPHINKSSWFRIGIIVFFLLLWTVGVTLVVSYVSPLDELVQTAPLEETYDTRTQVARLTLQRDSASVLNHYAKNLHASYSETSEKLKKRLELLPSMSTTEAFERLFQTIFSEEINAGLSTLDSRGSYGNKILSLNFDFDESPTSNSYTRVGNVFVEIWEPIVGMGETKKLGEDRTTSPVALSLLKPEDPAVEKPASSSSETTREKSSLSQDKYIPLVFGARSRYNYTRRIGKLLPESNRGLTVNTEYDRDEAKEEILKWVSEQSPRTNNSALRNIIQNIFQDIRTGLDLHVTELKSQADFFEKEKTAYEKKLNELQNRLRSSDSLFYVATVRAFLVTVVVISIGFVLIRAFAAELTQMRRMSYLEISSDIAAKYDPEKLPHIPEIVRAVGGDKAGQPILSDGAPPDAATMVESFGKAISKYANPAKP